jgi:two-component system chemotaxis response regulator CheY
MRVLVIDDSKAMRMIIKKILTESGFEVSEAENGVDALEKLKSGPLPEVALVDWNMPKMNGEEFISQIRNIPECRKIRLFIVTSDSQVAPTWNEAFSSVYGYILKPFTRESLLSKLASLTLQRI